MDALTGEEERWLSDVLALCKEDDFVPTSRFDAACQAIVCKVLALMQLVTLAGAENDP